MDAGTRTLRILYVGPDWGTCEQRARALEELGHDLTRVAADAPKSVWSKLLYRVGNRIGRPPDLLGTNATILSRLRSFRPDLLWVDKGRMLRAATLRRARELAPDLRIVCYSPDDMINPDNQSVQYLAGIPLYDLHVTTKSYNVEELRALGARDVQFVDNAYDPTMHRPIDLTAEQRREFAAEVGFIGSYEEEERAETLRGLARTGIPVTVWGADWPDSDRTRENLTVRTRFLAGADYAKAIGATRINLGFLRKVNRDLQTTRSIEIPACGAFMLAERTDEHLRLFEEGREAEFFDSFDELVRKCRYYLEHEPERAAIAAAGLVRCRRDGYSNRDRLAEVIARL